MIKYLILDFGKVLAYPTTGNWSITPKFLELVDFKKIDSNILKESIIRNEHIKSCGLLITNTDEEYKAMLEFYTNILKESYSEYSSELAEQIANDFVYGYDKYTLYDDVVSQLTRLSKMYKLILLSDNWPSVIDYMKEKKIYSIFDKIYVSSIYGCQKKDGSFFDYPIKDYNITSGEALFIDDNEENLDIAKMKGLDVLLMDRKGLIKNTKYKTVSELKEVGQINKEK